MSECGVRSAECGVRNGPRGDAGGKMGTLTGGRVRDTHRMSIYGL